MEVAECSLDRLHQRLDEIKEAIEKLRIDSAVERGARERLDSDMQDMQETVAKIQITVDRYKADRNFALGVLACIAALNGLGYKVATNYLDEINNKIKDAIFESSKNTSDISELKLKIQQHQPQVTRPPEAR